VDFHYANNLVEFANRFRGDWQIRDLASTASSTWPSRSAFSRRLKILTNAISADLIKVKKLASHNVYISCAKEFDQRVSRNDGPRVYHYAIENPKASLLALEGRQQGEIASAQLVIRVRGKQVRLDIYRRIDIHHVPTEGVRDGQGDGRGSCRIHRSPGD
jgi:hypothetical protein